MTQPAPPGLAIGKLRLVWLAFLAAPLLYFVVAAWITTTGGAGAGVDPELRQWVAIFVGMFSALTVLFVMLFRQVLASFTGGIYSTWCLLRWAFLEAIAIYGLVQVIALGLDLFVASAFFVLSLGTLAMIGPSEGDRQAYLELVE